MRYQLDQLEMEGANFRKQEWRPLLCYTAELHGKSIHSPRFPFSHPWEEIGPGYHNAPAFGHWDIAHAILDSCVAEPEHVRNQIRNLLALQLNDGMIGGTVWMRPEAPDINLYNFPPVWIHAVDEFCRIHQDYRLAAECLEPLQRQLLWFERKRRARGGGFRYTDLEAETFESGLDQAARFIGDFPHDSAFVDASCQVLWMYDTLAAWSGRLGMDPKLPLVRGEQLRAWIQKNLFHERTGFFHDAWHMNAPEKGGWGFDGIWALATGAATPEQAARVIDENLLSPERFLTAHPLPTVRLGDPLFELRMWRGPAWNSMTYFAAYGCARYHRPDAAVILLERTLDATALQFDRTGRIWEFYDPFGGAPERLQRKPESVSEAGPCPDYLGHNPLLAMSRLWEQCQDRIRADFRAHRETQGAIPPPENVTSVPVFVTI